MTKYFVVIAVSAFTIICPLEIGAQNEAQEVILPLTDRIYELVIDYASLPDETHSELRIDYLPSKGCIVEDTDIKYKLENCYNPIINTTIEDELFNLVLNSKYEDFAYYEYDSLSALETNRRILSTTMDDSQVKYIDQYNLLTSWRCKTDFTIRFYKDVNENIKDEKAKLEIHWYFINLNNDDLIAVLASVHTWTGNRISEVSIEFLPEDKNIDGKKNNLTSYEELQAYLKWNRIILNADVTHSESIELMGVIPATKFEQMNSWKIKYRISLANSP